MRFAFTTAGKQTSKLLGDDPFIEQHQAKLKGGNLRGLSIVNQRIFALSLME
jgi:hypothetical protein